LLVAAGMAYATTVLLLKRSILTEKIARRGLHITREYHADPFEQAWVRDVMVHEVDVVPADWSIGQAIDFFMAPEHRHKSYPIVDDARKVVGMVSRGDILAWIGEGEELDRGLPLAEACDDSALMFGRPGDLVGHLVDRMAEAGVGRVPVVDEEGALIGLVARKDLLAARARRAAEERDYSAYPLFGK
jgi:CBS-domain-containing membrane protein